MLAGLHKWWTGLNLVRQFAVMAVAVLLPGMLAVGWWISDRISEAVVHNTAAAVALYMDGLLAPFLQELESKGELSLPSRATLDTLLAQSRADSRIISMKVWSPDGTILYSSFPEMVGKKFPLSADFMEALDGQFGANFGSDPHVEDSHERQQATNLLEVYSPVRAAKTHKIIAISEFYANASELAWNVWLATLKTWAIVAAVATFIVLVLSGIVARGSRTIVQQRHQLAGQVAELQGLLEQNELLQTSLRKSNENVANINERVLQQLGSDLHDGPAQMLSYVAMRLSKLRRHFVDLKAGEKELANVSRILRDALQDVRKTSQGLLLPALESATLHDAITLAITTHEDHTGTRVARDISTECGVVPHTLTICAYRLVQEALNNAYKHAGGVAQRVSLRCIDGIEISIHDGGSGFDVNRRDFAGLGLLGMRARVEALGGELHIVSSAQSGTSVTAHFSAVKE
jgi:signal transduction histidine kinase